MAQEASAHFDEFRYSRLEFSIDDLVEKIRGKNGPPETLMGFVEEKIIETCFKVSMDYWSRVKSWLTDYEFYDARVEIVFFKHVKPLFTSQIEFYKHCYKGVLFLSLSKNEQILYWERELSKIQQFYDTHANFMKYWTDDPGDYDRLYFIRASNDGSNLDQAKN